MPSTNGNDGRRKTSVRATEISECLMHDGLNICALHLFLCTKNTFFCCTKTNSDSSCNLSSADWVLSAEELASKFTPRTKAIVINTPNNPLGKVSDSTLLLLFLIWHMPSKKPPGDPIADLTGTNRFTGWRSSRWSPIFAPDTMSCASVMRHTSGWRMMMPDTWELVS